jgi:hypothetical protein
MGLGQQFNWQLKAVSVLLPEVTGSSFVGASVSPTLHSRIHYSLLNLKVAQPFTKQTEVTV